MRSKRSEKGKAVATLITTAPKNNQHSESYRSSVAESRAKLQIGTLLLALQTPLNLKQQENGWQLFGAMLRQYIDLKYRRVG